VLGGYDDSGFYLYDLFADGTIDRCDDIYISSGSGSVMAYGVLETLYKKDLTLEEGSSLRSGLLMRLSSGISPPETQ